MTDKNGEEVSQLRGTEGGLHYFALSLVIVEVDYNESRPNKHLEQISTVLLTDERVRVRVNILNRLGIRDHKVLLLVNQVINHHRSQLNVTHPEETMNLEHLSVLLLPSEMGFTDLSKVDICEVSEERVTLLWAWDI
jgi:hypothetical protein